MQKKKVVMKNLGIGEPVLLPKDEKKVISTYGNRAWYFFVLFCGVFSADQDDLRKAWCRSSCQFIY